MKNPVLLLAATFTLAGPGYLIGAPLYWDLNGTAPGAGAAPAGTWDTATSNWNTDPDGIAGTPGLWTPGETAVFSAGTDAANPYTVTIAGTQSAGGIIQQDGTVTLSGGTLNLAASSILDVASSLTLSSIVGGGSAATRFTKLGAGNLVLSGANTFTGGFIISGGVVSHDGESSATAGTPSSSGALPAAAVADYFQLSNNAVLRNTRTGLGITALAANKGITLGIGGGTWDEPNFDSGNVHVYSGIITGTGQFTKSGAGVLALTAVQTYVGATNITGGVLRLRTNANLIPDGSAVNISPGAQFDVATFAETVGSIAGVGSVTGSATTTAIFTFGGDNTSTTFSGNISSTTGTATTRPVVKTGLGDLTIEGLEWANTGSVTIN